MTYSQLLLISLLLPAMGQTPETSVKLVDEVASADHVVALPSGVVSVHCGILKLWQSLEGHSKPVAIVTAETCVQPIALWGHSVTFLQPERHQTFDLIAYEERLLKRTHGYESYSERAQPRSGLVRVGPFETRSQFEFFDDFSGKTFKMQAPSPACLSMRDYPLPIKEELVLWQKCGRILAVSRATADTLWSLTPCGKGRDSILVPSSDFSLVLIVCIRSGLRVLDPLAPSRKYRMIYGANNLQVLLEASRFALSRAWIMKNGWLVTGDSSGGPLSVLVRCHDLECRIERFTNPLKDDRLRFYGERLEPGSVLLRDGEHFLESDGKRWHFR